MAGRVYSVPAGVSLVDALAAGLIAQFSGPPETLASVLVLVPTRRAVRSLREAFLRQSGGKALILPAIRPLGDVDEDDLALAGFAEAEAAADLPPAIPPLLRRLTLARRIHAASGQLGPMGDEQAAQLADALALFLDEVATAEADFDDLEDLVEEGDLSRHWQTTLAFLRAILADWPRTLERMGYLDPAQRRRMLMDRLAEHWASQPPAGPVIAAGSTGTIPATARLLARIAALPRGAVVLPGLDTAMGEEAWSRIEPSHPQHALKNLLERLGMTRAEVEAWPFEAGPDLPAGSAERRQLLSDALLPAEATAAWPELPAPSPAALEGLEIAACASPRVEAEIAALRMRQELETPARTVALVTRDRDLARRVASELRRWDIAVDDSAGVPLALTRCGAFVRLIAVAAAERLAPVALLALLKHPLTRLGGEDVTTRQAVRRLELAVLRGPRPAPGIAGLRAALEGSEQGGADLHALLDRLEAALGGLLQETERQRTPLALLVEHHVAAALQLARGPDDDGGAALWGGDDGLALHGFIAELDESAQGYGMVDPRAWPALLDTLMTGHVVRPRYGSHPRAFIWSPLEARMQHADCVILGGLVEGNWPPEPPGDPWMSRPMREKFGLASPEQRIGQAAHDFVQTASAPHAVLLHPLRASGAPCVPARWIVRLEAFLAAKGLATAPYENAARWRDWQALLDRPATVEPARPPLPCPPLEARPASLPVTQVQTWLADPYAIYARHVLELRPLDALDEDASANVRGSFIHDALETFVRRHPTTLPDDALDELIAIGEAALSGPLDRPAVRAIWWRRFRRIAAWFVETERQRRTGLSRVHAETHGSIVLAGDGERPFTLVAKADRIEVDDDGSVRIIDYKTGSVPTDKAVVSGRAPQLPLEAAMARAGGFRGIAAGRIAEIAHWKLSGGEPAGECKPAKGKDLTPETIADQALEGLTRLVGAFSRPDTPYRDHPGGAPIGPWDAYTDIARTQEWRLAPDGDAHGMLPDLPGQPAGPRPFRVRTANPAQQRMSDPERTVWVAASAGTGKTKVLTDRVLRLLLAGTAPSRILCLTFTKAAAAEMAIRVRHELAVWLGLDETALTAELAALTGREPEEDERRRARHLFAQVLDAPGGLQIATIHGFCQSLLGRFPLEAGVPPHFTLIEERGRDELLHSAHERVLARIVESGDDAMAADLDTLAIRAGESRVVELIGEVCASARRLHRAIAHHGSLEAMIDALRAALRLSRDDSDAGIAAAACVVDAEHEARLRRAAAGLAEGSKTDVERAARIAAWLDAGPQARAAGLAEYQRAFLTGTRTPVKNLATKVVLKADPEIAAILQAEQDRMVVLDERQRAMETLTRTAVLLRIGHAVIEEFRRLKEDRAVLDYDDLIERAQELLAHDGMAPWVLFKLDGGIDHILVDEAQDTNPSQWSVVLALTDEFFAGEGASEIVRTLFVVGDEKQSIFSFQGADLDALRAVHRHLRARVSTVPGAWLEEPLDLSYRSVPAVLDVVDAVFARGDAAEGVAFDGARIEHGSNRSRDAGLVELWPPVEDELVEERDVWLAPLEDSQPRDRHTRLAAGIAGRIAAMVGEDGEILESRGTPIRAGDVMILVRKRSEVVAALVRELRRAGIPVAGVDRMDLTAQVVARDLMALGRFCLMPEDDVALASVLKGPFVDFDDDALYALAHGRERQGLDDGRRARPEALWATLRRRGGESDAWGRARHWLGELLGLADQMAPVEFVSHVLTRPAATQDGFSGRRALIRRLGLEAQDPLDELLNLAFAFEAEHPPSLEGFLSWLGAGSAEVKREPEGAGDVVRIMTVHGAKGLQAPVVFLIDDIGSPPGQSVTLLWDDARELALWSGGAEGREALARQLHEARRKRQEQEERRLLYVALTRASDRLYIATSRKSEDKEGAGWTSLIAAGMEGLAEPFAFAATGETWSGEGLRLRTVQTRPVEACPGDSATAERNVRLPDAFRRAMAAERPGDRPLSPSRLQGEAPPPPSPLAGDDGAGLRRGRIVHRLLELLPGIAAAQRREAARRLIGRHAPDWPREQVDTLAHDLLALLDAAEHAALFAPGSTAEVSIVGKLGDTVIAGQVDRLVVTPGAVLIVDYKTGAMPQGGAGATPEAYLRQLAAYRAVLRQVYPGRAVRCALLWVDRPEFVPIPDTLLGRYEPL